MDSCPCLKVHLLDICAKTSTDGWMDDLFMGYFSWLEEVPLWWEIGMHSSKKNGCITWRRWDFNQPVCQDDFSHISHVNVQTNIDFLESTYFHSEAYCIILDWIISFWNLPYIYYHVDKCIYIYITHTVYTCIQFPTHQKCRSNFSTWHRQSWHAVPWLPPSPQRRPTTHGGTLQLIGHSRPRRTEKPHSVLQEFDGDTIPQLQKHRIKKRLDMSGLK